MTQTKTENPLKQALKYGQSIWYDGLISKEEFFKMIEEDGLRGATTNPTIFEKALSAGNYDKELKKLSGTYTEEEIYKTLAVEAVQQIVDVFLPVYQEANGRDGFVSIEVSPLLAYDTEKTIQEARELWRLVNRPNVMIKIPATKQGIPAIQTVISEGIHVNVTLIFSVERYREVMEAYISGLEKRSDAGHPVSGVASVASFFVSRVDTAVDKLLEEKGDKPQKGGLSPFSLQGKIAIANSKVAYAEFEKVFSGARFEKLRSKGAQAQRALWASTGTKNSAYSDVIYVEALMGDHTVNTIPPATMAAFRDHGTSGSRLNEGLEEALQNLERLAALGIDLKQVTEDLEKVGVQLFADSYNKIIQLIREKE